MIAEPLLPLVRPVADLRTLEGNPRRGDVQAVKRSLQRFGQRKPIVARDDGTVIAGNHTLLAARELGWAEIAVVGTDDDEATAKAYALADNRTSALGSFDMGDLAAMAVEVHAVDPELLLAASFTEDDLNALLAGKRTGKNDPDDAPEPPAEPITVLGDVWLLGPHRLLCGNAQIPEHLDRLLAGDLIGCVLTDPPYGMNLDADYSKMPGGNARSQMHRQPKKYRQVEGDDKPFDASFLRLHFSSVKEQFWFGADYYRRTLSPDDRDGSWLIWDKRQESQDDVIGSGFETCWSASPHQRRVLRHYWCGAFGSPEARNRYHPTQKPVSLLADILTRWAPADAAVCDPFGGSGSTLLACHQTGRTARLMELDPAYCDVICRRYQEHTGTKPVLESTGEPHDFT